MPFDVKNTNELAGLTRETSLRFAWSSQPMMPGLRSLKKWDTSNCRAGQHPRGARRDPLAEGDTMPIMRSWTRMASPSSSANTGASPGFAFFYTRCPYPDFCPRTSNQLRETMKQLQARPDAPANWHLLSISSM